MLESNNKGVLVIYTGGTIGSVPKDPLDLDSPRVIAPWQELKAAIPELKTIGFRVEDYSFEPSIDSSNMTPQHWVEMAEVIEKNYDDYEGFVIAHGTDTMAYTASALSFMLENLSKPVVLTGSQVPIAGYTRNDGVQNLITSILIANPAFSRLPVVPEVCLFFGNKLLRGNRSQKVSSSGFTGFSSPNYPPLGEAGGRIVIDEQYARKPAEQPLIVHKKLKSSVALVPLFPGIQMTDCFEQVFSKSSTEAVVLETYGSGNAPSDSAFLKVVADASSQGKIVLNVTQCPIGTVELGLYETSVKMLDQQVLSGSDITREAAICKLMVLLGDNRLNHREVKNHLEQNRAGEQSTSIYTITFGEAGKLQGGESHHFAGDCAPLSWGCAEISRVTLRLRDISLAGKELDSIEFMVYLSTTDRIPFDTNGPDFAGRYSRQVDSMDGTLSFDITQKGIELLKEESRFFGMLVLGSGDATLEWGRAEIAVVTRAK